MTGEINHIELYVSNLQKSISFWKWLLEKLGYLPYQNWEKGKSWKKGMSYIVFVQVEEKYFNPPYHRKRVGLNHIAFSVSREQLHDFKLELAKKKIPLLYQDKNIRDTLFFEDPDRIKVELKSERLKSVKLFYQL